MSRRVVLNWSERVWYSSTVTVPSDCDIDDPEKQDSELWALWDAANDADELDFIGDVTAEDDRQFHSVEPVS